MSQKGSGFERETCKALGLWWTQDLKEPRDDLFWRSSQSGGRATVRGRKGKGTYGSYGDIAATDPLGKPLMDLLTFECKKGYNRSSIGDLLDREDFRSPGKVVAQQTWESFLQQTWEAWQRSGSYAWLLVTKRDHRKALVTMPRFLMKGFLELGCFRVVHPFVRQACMDVRFFDKNKKHVRTEGMNLSMVTWESFLKEVKPQHVGALAKST